jgi:hypothetical protein
VVTTGTGLVWLKFLHGERPGAITLQFADLIRTLEGIDVNGWGLYREDTRRRGQIRSGNVILDVEAVRTPIRDFQPALGHELGHALSLQHPLPCRRWTRMDPGRGSCNRVFDVNPAPGTFWSPVERAAGKLVYTFRPGTDFGALPTAP